jgi:hypothetical protein
MSSKLSSTVVTEQPFHPGLRKSQLKDNPAELARFMGKYTSHYYAGGFAHPTRADLEKEPERVDLRGSEKAPFLIISRELDRAGRRRDFTGDNFQLPAGIKIATLVTRDHDSVIPSMKGYDYVTIYPEDHDLRDGVLKQGFVRAAVRCTPQAEVIGYYARPGMPVREYEPFDQATVQRIPVTVPEELRDAFLAEVDGLDSIGGWRDDVPFYNAGAWGSLSLRGFWPDDPTRGSKPAEMADAYKKAHPEDADRECDWTVMTELCPTITSWVKSLPWSPERVRIVRLAGGGGELERHTDGTRNRDFTRLHIPLITNPKAKLHNWTLDGDHLQTWLEPWGAYYLDTRKPHAVTNTSDDDRIHLVVDLHSSESLHSLIGSSWLTMPDSRGAKKWLELI